VGGAPLLSSARVAEGIALILTRPCSESRAGWWCCGLARTGQNGALLRLVDEFRDNAAVGDATWDVLRAAYDDLQLIEIPVIVGQYQLVAYFTNTMGCEPDPELPRLAGA
jgi:hypothetical protein